MKTLTIKDLSVNQDLDTSAMLSVRGGIYKSYGYVPGFSESKHDFTFAAEQLSQQKQDNVNLTGNNAAFVSGISSSFKPGQTNSNSISF